MKYYLKTFGCQMNKSDSERISALLENIGYKPTTDIKQANFVLINSCSVRASAEDRIFGMLRNLKKQKKENPHLVTAVTGCMATKNPERIRNKADIVLDIRNLFTLPQRIKQIIEKKQDHNPKGDLYETYDYLKISPFYKSSFQAYVPIMTGCNNFCSYCVVPYARGKEFSRSAPDIIAEIEELVSNGYKAITLLGQNVNSYQDKSDLGDINFPTLLKMINKIPGDFWIWFVTSHPKDLSDELIYTIADSEKVCNYIHLPVQAGSNKILKSMNRKYTKEHYLKLLKKLDKNLDEYSLSTDVIVGFPGETQGDFEETLALFKKAKFDMAYIAQYSMRLGTAAAKLVDDVPLEEKKERKNILNTLLMKNSLEYNQLYLNNTASVLVEAYSKGKLIGKTRTFKTVKFDGDKKLVGNIVNVKITEALDWGMNGILVQ